MPKTIKLALKLILGLSVSLLLTLILIMFTPSIFDKALNIWVQTLPTFKYVDYQIGTKADLVNEFKLPSKAQSDDIVRALKTSLPNFKDKSSPFFNLLAVHAYPDPCKFTLIGIHRTIDITWTVEGLRCKGKEACELARTQHICPDKKKHH